MKRLWVLAFILLLLLLIGQDSYAANFLTSAEAREDAAYLWRQLEEVHPNLYFHTSKEEASREMAAIEERLASKDEWTFLELYRLFAPFVAGFRDGHTSVSVYNLYQKAGEGVKLFPLLVDVDAKGMQLVADLSGNNLPGGVFIKSINGVSSEEIIQEIMKGISYEREAFAYIILSSSFPLYLWAYYDFGDEYQLSYETEAGRVESVELEGITWEEYREKRDGIVEEKDTDNWSLNFLRDDTALLTINTFNGRLEKEFKAFIQDSFRGIKDRGTAHLIIDLRENGGGSTVLSNYLYEFISAKPYRTFAEVRVKYSPLAIKERTSFLAKPYFFIRRLLGQEMVVYKNQLRKPGENELRFQGEVYVLTGPMTFSTATDFAALIKDLEAGTIVGEETGGLATCYGDVLYTQLPNSGLDLGISYKYFIRPGGFDDGRGVLPDFEVVTDPVLKLQGKDAALEKVLNLIDQGFNRKASS